MSHSYKKWPVCDMCGSHIRPEAARTKDGNHEWWGDCIISLRTRLHVLEQESDKRRDEILASEKEEK